MNNDNFIKDILYMFLILILIVLGFKFIIWIFPIVLLLIIGYIIYKYISINKNIKNVKNTKNTKKKNKEIKVIHEFDED